MKLSISPDFRHSMDWLHTWLGIGLGMVLFVIFWTGTLTVFDKEIDQWMKPELRIPAQQDVALDPFLPSIAAELDPAQGSEFWLSPPQPRVPAIRVFYEDHEGHGHEAMYDPRTGEQLDLTDSHAGSDFFFPFHYMLHIPGIAGYWIVGIAGFGMLVLTVSGLFIHRKIFQDFFTFRPKRKPGRASLDFHNLTAMIALPFHILIPLSGLFVFASTYFPWALAVPYEGNLRGMNAEMAGYEELAVIPSGQALPTPLRVDRYMDRAAQAWALEEGASTSAADWVGLFNYGDENAYILVERYFPNDRVSIGPHQMTFDPNTEAMLDRFDPKPIHSATNWLEGLHWIQFDHWTLRWLYFLAGLSGCAMIGSGLVYWMQARIRRDAVNSTGVRILRAMTVGATAGIICASAAFLIANRVIPKVIELNVHRHDLEIWVFFTVWLLSFGHASLRGKAAWREQSYAIALLAAGGLMSYWLTTGDHVFASLSNGLFAIAGVDCVLMIGGAVSLLAGFQLKRSAHTGQRSNGPIDLEDAITSPAEG